MKASIFARELPPYPPDEVLGTYQENKWEKFDEFLEGQRQEGIELLAVAFPEVLGDDYLELLVNLSKIAKEGLHLAIMDPSPAIRQL